MGTSQIRPRLSQTRGVRGEQTRWRARSPVTSPGPPARRLGALHCLPQETPLPPHQLFTPSPSVLLTPAARAHACRPRSRAARPPLGAAWASVGAASHPARTAASLCLTGTTRDPCGVCLSRHPVSGVATPCGQRRPALRAGHPSASPARGVFSDCSLKNRPRLARVPRPRSPGGARARGTPGPWDGG